MKDIIQPHETVDLKCDCCSSPMVMRKFDAGGGAFICTSCDQEWGFEPNGRVSCVVIAKLFPSGIKPGTKLYLEYLRHRVSGIRFVNQAKVLCGLQTEEEAAHKISVVQREFDLYVARHRKPSLWRRLTGFFVGRKGHP